MGFEDIDLDEEQGNSSKSLANEYEEDFEEFVEESVKDESQISDYNYHELNLNKMTPEEGLIHKKKMDVVFNKNIKKPSDPDYLYDKRINFV